MGPRLPRITEKFGLRRFLVLLTFIVWGALQYMLTSDDNAKEYTKETARRQYSNACKTCLHTATRTAADLRTQT